jgi:hypothetical protein
MLSFIQSSITAKSNTISMKLNKKSHVTFVVLLWFIYIYIHTHTHTHIQKPDQMGVSD